MSNQQKAAICILAREAHEKLTADCADNTDSDFRTSEKFSVHSRVSRAISFSAWRREQQLAAVAKESLRDCVQGDYLKLVAHFQDLKGETGRAVKTHMRDAVQEKAIALRKLETECALRGLDLSYPARICKSKFKCALDEATPRQLWCLVFDIRTSSHGVLPTKHTKKTNSSDSEVLSPVLHSCDSRVSREEDPF